MVRSLNQRSLVSIGEASLILGVSQATLRQWTNEGKVKAFITPGGHRRYKKSELEHLVGQQKRRHGLNDLVARMKQTPPMHRQLARTQFSATLWYNRLDAGTRERLAKSGRELLHLVIRYISQPPKRKHLEARARDIGNDFGRETARLGLSLTETIETFTLHRKPLMDVITGLIRKRETLDNRAAEAIPLATHIFDQTLIAMIAAYQHYREHQTTG